MHDNNQNGQLSAYGLWHVTTEGDVEGQTTKDLGTHEGFLDEIAFALASSAAYGLRFSAVEEHAYKNHPPQTQVNVSLDIGTSTWNLKSAERVNFFKKLLESRPVSVRTSMYYASVTLVSGRNPAEQERLRKEAARRAALAKLSPDDMEALGLK